MNKNEFSSWSDQNPRAAETVNLIIDSFRAAQKSQVKVKDPVDGLLDSLGLDRDAADAFARPTAPRVL